MFQFEKFQLNPGGDPVARIADVLIGYALQEKAREIRLHRLSENREVTVFYLVRDTEQLIEQMRVPSYVWQPLKAHFKALTGDDDSFKFELASKNHWISLTYTLTIDVSPALHGETIVLKLNGPSMNPA
jgi:hypothetical protein